MWASRTDWDDPNLPKDLLQAWNEWEQELSQLQTISLAHCYTSSSIDSSTCQCDIHIFCDASERAYGSVAYLRSEDASGTVEVAFRTARSRVAPRKQQTIPRLELSAALTDGTSAYY